MLAQRRSLTLDGVEVERTPLLVPSFSSKGFPDIQKIVEYSTEIIEGPLLVSAYDLHYGKIELPYNFASTIFLDSGGYEASKDTELSDLGSQEHISDTWTQEFHEAVVREWKSEIPTVLISYDHPKERLPLSAQIERAKSMAPRKTGVMRGFLIKPEAEKQIRLKVEPILECVSDLAEFDLIGVTEKEIGNSIIARMKNIARLRRALHSVGLNTPIHVFGSLDTITTPMYFIAGADIFDGLTWLRYAFHDGQTIYKHVYGALKLGIQTPYHVIDGRCWNDNYYYMKELQLEMRRFLNGHRFEYFKHHQTLFHEAYQSVIEEVGE